jgi:hypothetical protein
MKHTVRLKRGLYVLLDSYKKPSFIRNSLPFLFCLAAVLTAGITLQYIEEQKCTLQAAYRASQS